MESRACLTVATNTNAADNHSSYLTEHILPSVIGRRKRVHSGVDVQSISKRLVNVENSYMVQSRYRHLVDLMLKSSADEEQRMMSVTAAQSGLQRTNVHWPRYC